MKNNAEKFKTALQEIAYAGKYYTLEDMIEIAKKALKTDPNVGNISFRASDIKERLHSGLFQTLEVTEQDLFDIQYLLTRIEEYIRANIKLTQNYVESMDRIERYEKVIHDIAFGYVEGDYSDVRQYAREALDHEKK